MWSVEIEFAISTSSRKNAINSEESGVVVDE
jgi:hypothetical protein